MILGAILAGGRSSRFGSDKALAKIDGVTLIDRNTATLDGQVDRVAICGRPWRDYLCLSDRPVHGLGPLGGLAAALHMAATENYRAVISLPVDALDVPLNLPSLLEADEPAYFQGHHLIGFWPSSLSATLDAHIGEGHRSVRSWLSACSATSVIEPHRIGNANFAGDLASFLPIGG